LSTTALDHRGFAVKSREKSRWCFVTEWFFQLADFKKREPGCPLGGATGFGRLSIAARLWSRWKCKTRRTHGAPSRAKISLVKKSIHQTRTRPRAIRTFRVAACA